MDLAEILIGASHQGPAADDPQPLPEAQIATLREVAAAYVRPCPFAVGDLITPVQASSLRKKGMPHIVLEVCERPKADLTPPADLQDAGSVYFGARRDIRVAAHYGSDVAAFWVESWQFEPYREPAPETPTT